MASVKNLRVIRVSYRRATWVVCVGNLVVTLCMMYLMVAPLYLRAASLPDLAMAVSAATASPTNLTRAAGGRYGEHTLSKENVERFKASYQLRRALMPLHLIQEVKELQAETEVDIKRTKTLSAARYKRSVEVFQRLAQVCSKNGKRRNYKDMNHGTKVEGQSRRGYRRQCKVNIGTFTPESEGITNIYRR